MQKRKQHQYDKTSKKTQHTSEYLKKEVASLYSSLGFTSDETGLNIKQQYSKK